MLQVRIHHDDGVAARGVQSRGEGDLVAEIAGERVDVHGGVARTQRVQLFQGAVPAAVINEDDAMVQPGEGLQNRFNRFVKLLDHLFLVVTGSNNTEELGFIGHRLCL